MANNSDIFKKQGYIVLPQGLSQDDMTTLESSSQALSQRAGELLAELAESGESLSDFYKRNDDELIVVPEIDDPSESVPLRIYRRLQRSDQHPDRAKAEAVHRRADRQRIPAVQRQMQRQKPGRRCI